MAKELPYFKFEPNAWENGNIQMLSREDKGLFIDVCSMYWSRLGQLPEKLVIQKLCGGNASALVSLYEEKIIESIDSNIYIKFLSIQLDGFENTSDQNSKNAKLRWEKHRKQKQESERNASALNSQSETDAIREEKSREDKINNTYDYPFSKIKDFQDTLKSFTLNKSYFFIAYRFWELWKKESPNSKTLQDANIFKWYNVIRLIIEVDNQKIERLLLIYFYFDKCQREEAGFDRFWFDTIKSVGALRKKDKNDVYRIDVIMDKINNKIQTDDAFNQLINSKIKEFKQYEITKLH